MEPPTGAFVYPNESNEYKSVDVGGGGGSSVGWIRI